MTDTKTRKVFVKAIFSFIIGVTLATLFFWTIIEGITTHINGDKQLAMIYYALAFLSGITAVYNYLQAKTLFYYAKMS